MALRDAVGGVSWQDGGEGYHPILVIASSSTCRQQGISEWRWKMGAKRCIVCVDRAHAKKTHQLTSMSSRLSCAPMTRSTFFLLLSCISPAINSSSRMK